MGAEDLNIFACLDIVIACLLWGAIVLFYKALSAGGFTPMQVVAVRVAISSIVLVPVLFLKNKALLKIAFKDLWIFLGSGVVSFVAFNFFYFRAVDLTTVSVSVVLLNTAPIFIMLIALILFGEKLIWQKLAALALTVVGCLFMTGVGDMTTNYPVFGVFCGLASGLTYGLYSIFGTLALRKGYDSLTIITYTFVFGVLGVLPFIDFAEIMRLVNKTTIYPIVGISVVCTVLPFLFFTKGLSKIDSGTTSIIATLELVFVSLTGFLFLGEVLTTAKLIGMAAIIFAIVLLNIKR